MKPETTKAMLAAQTTALRHAMEAVINGFTPDHAKWVGVNNFVRKYCPLAGKYQELTGDGTISVYDLDKLRNPYDMVWPAQKSLFDSVYTETLMLQSTLAVTESSSHGPLYNLFVSGDVDDWNGEPFQIELSRCLREYTDPTLSNQYGGLDAASISELKRLPSIFAYVAY